MKLNTRTIVAIGIGSAIFLVLNRFVAIPTPIPNTNISTAYAFLAFMAALFGPIAGALIGFIGHTLTDMLAYGSVWWSWVIASAVFGALVGFVSNRLAIERGETKMTDFVTFNVYQVLANLIAWVLVAPILDILIYSEPVNKVFTQGATAGLANLVSVLILGTIFLFAYAKTKTQSGSLKEE